MTGYGKGTQSTADKKFIAEIRTLNSKQADIGLRMPKEFIANEIEIRTRITDVLERGKIDCSITIEALPTSQDISLNRELFGAYYNQTMWLQNEYGFDKNEHIKYLLANPDLAKLNMVEPSKDEINAIFDALTQALASVDEFRINEGQTLEKDFSKRLSIISDLLSSVEGFESERISRIKDKIYAQLRELNIDKTDSNRLEQELIYYLEKLDFTEEKVRLAKHIAYFRNTLTEERSEGKKLGFIAQEFTREINTLGSKANDASIQQIVVKMKDEVEKIKEQLFNIL